MGDPLANTEARALFATLLVSLTAESDRGALLVGTAHVDNTLRSLFEAVFPASLAKKRRGELLKYPGPLSSLASRAHVAYALRLIPRPTYDAVNALRAMRNDAAHAPESFTLIDQEQRIQRIYAAMGSDVPNGLRQIALEAMLDYKSHVLVKAARDLAAEDADIGLLIEDKAQALEWIREHLQDSELTRSLGTQLLRWELATGIALL